MGYTITGLRGNGKHRAARRPRRRLLLAVVAGVTVAATLAGVTAAHAGTGSYLRPDRAVCGRQAPSAGRVPFARELGASGITWQYVSAGEARYFGISPCSVVIGGWDDSVILSPRGRVVATS